MHWTVSRTFDQFMESYLPKSAALTVLEIGSANVNGGLRDRKRENMDWIGVDLDAAPGVDQTVRVGEALPFESERFDVVLASSVFEHDIQFWKTFLEMARVLKRGGLLLLTIPSQGYFHRHTLDAFRFYPDAGLALEKWAQSEGYPLALIESFTTPPEGDVWADFVAIFSTDPARFSHAHIGEKVGGENWIVGSELIQKSYQEIPHDLRRISDLEAKVSELTSNLDLAHRHIRGLMNTHSWVATKQLRIFYIYLRTFVTKVKGNN